MSLWVPVPAEVFFGTMQRLPLLIHVLLWASFAHAAQIDLPVHYDTLANGLRVIVVPDTNVAVVSCRLYYHVGSMYEGPGTSGLSHMYEHMMFKGTKALGTHDYDKEKPFMARIDSLDKIVQRLRDRGVPETDTAITSLRGQISQQLKQQRVYVKKDEIWQLYMNNGGTHLNAWTGDDMTAYIVTLPMNKVELFYSIESDRMQNPVLREFYSERDVVTEERRMRYENRPVSRYWERLSAHFYIAHPYRIPTIGWMSDIRSYTRERLRDHVNRFYTPDNAVLVLVGNIDPAKALADIGKYFGPIPPARNPKREVATREPPPIGETRFTVYDDAEPRIDIFYHIPGYPHDDLYQLDVAEGILSGRSGRLYDRLVNEEQLCTNAAAGCAFRLHDGYFHVWATLKNDASPQKVEEIILAEIGKLAAEAPSAHEMKRIKNTIRMNFVSGLKGLEGISDRLAWFERLRTWRDMFEYPARIVEVDAESVPEVVGRYLKPELKTIGLLLAKPGDSSSGEEKGK